MHRYILEIGNKDDSETTCIVVLKQALTKTKREEIIKALQEFRANPPEEWNDDDITNIVADILDKDELKYDFAGYEFIGF